MKHLWDSLRVKRHSFDEIAIHNSYELICNLERQIHILAQMNSYQEREIDNLIKRLDEKENITKDLK